MPNSARLSSSVDVLATAKYNATKEVHGALNNLPSFRIRRLKAQEAVRTGAWRVYPTIRPPTNLG